MAEAYLDPQHCCPSPPPSPLHPWELNGVAWCLTQFSPYQRSRFDPLCSLKRHFPPTMPLFIQRSIEWIFDPLGKPEFASRQGVWISTRGKKLLNVETTYITHYSTDSRDQCPDYYSVRGTASFGQRRKWENKWRDCVWTSWQYSLQAACSVGHGESR